MIQFTNMASLDVPKWKVVVVDGGRASKKKKRIYKSQVEDYNSEPT